MFARAASRALAHGANATTTTQGASRTMSRASSLARAVTTTTRASRASSPSGRHSRACAATRDAHRSAEARERVSRARNASMGGRGAATATTTARAGRWMDDLYDDDFDEDENPWADDDDFDEDDDEDDDEDEEGGGKVRDASAHKDALRGVGGPRVRDELPLPPKGVDTTPPRRVTKDDVTISFARSGGAGGQNVNKVNTKVDMRLNVDGAVAAGWLPRWCADRLVVAEKNRMNNDGELVVNSTRHRTQSKNVDDALEKLQSYINRAAKLPGNKSDKKKKKKLRANVEKGNKRRLADKKQTSEKKSSRRAGKNIKNFDDY